MATLLGDSTYFSVKGSYKYSDGTRTLMTGSQNRTVDITNQIEREFGNKSVLYPEAEVSSSSYSIYHTPESDYTLEDDGKYHISDKANTLSKYSLTHDFSYGESLVLSFDGYDAIVEGKVSDTNVPSFLKGDYPSVTSLAFTVTFNADDKSLSQYVLTYKDKDIFSTITLRFDAFESALTLPIV